MTPGERALRGSVALIHPFPRAVFSLTGERPLAYLHDVLAQDVLDLSPGRGALAAALTPTGRVSAELRVIPLEDSIMLDAEPEAAAGIEERIGRHAGLAGCELIAVDLSVAAHRGPDADDAIATAGIQVPGAQEAAFAREGDVLAVRVVWGVPGVDLIGSRQAVNELCRRLDAVAATTAELETARIDAGRPRFGPDMNEGLLVNETPLLTHAVSMTKGCYPGQESVAKVHNLGNVRRMLRSLRSESGALVPGADVTANGSVVGHLTSAASLANGAAAIALLRSEVAPGSVVDVNATNAVVGALD